MFVNILTNAETGRRRAIRIDTIRSITYNGKTVITILYLNQRKSQSICYPTEEMAQEQYKNIMQQIGANASI